MAKQENVLTRSVLELLRGHPKGLEADEVITALRDGDGAISPRGVRNLLNRLADENQLVRRRRKASGRGTPPFAYLHPENVKQAPSLFGELMGEEADTRLHTREQAEREALDTEELARLERSRSVLENIARGHLSEEQYARAVIDAAPALADIDPVELLVEMAEWIVKDLNAMADEIAKLLRGNNTADAVKVTNELELRLGCARRYFQRLWRFDGPAGDDPCILNLPSSPRRFVMEKQRAVLNADAARQRLRQRIRGAKVIEVLTATATVRVAAGTDASVADIFLEHNRGSFIPPDPVSVMTGAAALVTRADPKQPFQYQDFDIFPDQLREYEDHQAAIKGLVISPLLKQVLPEEDLKHSRLAAMDLRQYVEDFRIAVRQAEWRPVGSAPALGIVPRTSLIIRDGRLLPLVHRLKDFESAGLYGQIVRNELEQFSQVIHHTLCGPTGKIVYGATVKNPEMSWLAPLVFWYIHTRKSKVDGKRVIEDPADVYRIQFSDTAVSHLLFFGLAKKRGALTSGTVFTTFRATRQFSDIAFEGDESFPLLLPDGVGERPLKEDDLKDWKQYMTLRIHEHAKKRRDNALDLEDYSPFLYLCANVGVAMCYAAPVEAYGPLVAAGSGEGAHFLLPRIEVAVLSSEAEAVDEHLLTLLSWMATGGCEMDRAHTQSGYDTGRDPGLPILVPDVIVYAHEAATFARSKMSDEVQDEIRQRIADLRKWLGKGK